MKTKAVKKPAAPAARKSIEDMIAPGHWNIVLVVVAFILILGIFAGVANLVQVQRVKAVSEGATMHNVFTATHSKAEVEDFADLAMSRMTFAGEIDSVMFDTSTGKWAVEFTAIGKSSTATIKLRIDDVSLSLDEADFLLPIPEIKPVALTPGNDPTRGAADAKVTMYIFSDFECAFCASVEPTLSSLMSAYGDRVKFVFKNYPLDTKHPSARKAAEAAECANEQGMFWEYHDKLFANQQALSTDDLKKYAADLGLDAVKFGACLDSGSMAQEVESDYQEGVNEGVSGTPTFFINQQFLSGSLPLGTFEKIIDRELAK
jgi:protein-disulfide isomerase